MCVVQVNMLYVVHAVVFLNLGFIYHVWFISILFILYENEKNVGKMLHLHQNAPGYK